MEMKMRQVIVVYDDRKKPNKEIAAITGQKSFGKTIFKRRTLREMIEAEAGTLVDFDEGLAFLKQFPEQTVFCHLFSSFGVRDKKEFSVLQKKASFAHQVYAADCGGMPAMGIFPSVSSYRKFVEESEADSGLMALRLKEETVLESGAFVDLGKRNEFLRFITSGFDARFFNALQGDEYTVTKKSSNKNKIKSEYNFYHMLPETMKMWFVMPFHYQEEEDSASYTMERLHVTDIAIRYVHGAIDGDEMHDILDKLFYFLSIREKKEVSIETYREVRERLYVKKVEERIDALKEHPSFPRLETLIRSGTGYDGIDAIVDKYKKVYHDLTKNEKRKPELVIGHGDLCFSNILYQKDAGLLKLIDPKGCLSEEELYTDPYYDLAKLSHSICGNYDFFNSGLYEVTLGEDMRFHLSVDSENAATMEIFQDYLRKAGFDYRTVRIYEASLFLSMLPLHMDREQKVFALLLNAIGILERV